MLLPLLLTAVTTVSIITLTILSLWKVEAMSNYTHFSGHVKPYHLVHYSVNIHEMLLHIWSLDPDVTCNCEDCDPFGLVNYQHIVTPCCDWHIHGFVFLPSLLSSCTSPFCFMAALTMFSLSYAGSLVHAHHTVFILQCYLCQHFKHPS